MVSLVDALLDMTNGLVVPNWNANFAQVFAYVVLQDFQGVLFVVLVHFGGEGFSVLRLVLGNGIFLECFVDF